ncbi:tetratricopeptide repeat protein [Thermosulfuriphilus sp.]
MRTILWPWKRLSLALIGLFSLVSPALAYPDLSPRAEAYYQFLRGEYAASVGHIDEAIDSFERLIRLDPEAVLPLEELARIYATQNKLKQALKYAEKASKKDPQNVSILIILGRLYASQGRYERAVATLEKALEVAPDQTEALMLISSIYAENRRYKEAIETLKRFLKVKEDSFMGHYYLARIYRQMKDYDQAIKEYRRTIELNPRFEGVWLELAHLYELIGRPDQALATYQECLRSSPPCHEALSRILDLLVRQGKAKEAQELLKRWDLKQMDDSLVASLIRGALILLEANEVDRSIAILEDLQRKLPDDPRIHFYLGLAYETKGDLKKAISQYATISEDSNFYSEALNRQALCLSRLGKEDEAVFLLEGAIKRFPDKVQFRRTLASIYESQGRFDKAEEAIREALKLVPEDTSLLLELAYILERASRREEALKVALKVLEKEPENPAALNFVGYTWADMGIKLDEAEEMIKKALKARPNDGYIIDSLGWVYYRKGQYKKAFQELKKAVSLTPDDPIINEHLADVCVKLGYYQRALKYYEKARSLYQKDKDHKRLKKKIKKTRERLEMLEDLEP